jgi:hypothetical protein
MKVVLRTNLSDRRACRTPHFVRNGCMRRRSLRVNFDEVQSFPQTEKVIEMQEHGDFINPAHTRPRYTRLLKAAICGLAQESN